MKRLLLDQGQPRLTCALLAVRATLLRGGCPRIESAVSDGAMVTVTVIAPIGAVTVPFGMKFEWDPQKDAANVTKHGVSFAEASTVFGDPLAGPFPIRTTLRAEMRFLTIGLTATGRLVVVSHTEEEDDLFRIISSREATIHERKAYEG